ncbi:BUB1 N-terminal domain-containing protein [Heracleum sosnowskyi]|uniref:BUB1 N-terminal domain-containing protein n=1 Tax=Heracleum sosnowskyi TaxID=360622 RepID=A0AAD8GV33_9APIA|nr:BUB1 N-terminal domain-containing protein [Heracleum sosnowskyi]
MAESTEYNNLFASLISDIKSYSGKDPLVPWLRGIRKMKDTLPPQLLKEKLPRFLQKCAEAFVSDRRYTNDLRYLRVWLQLMDFVDDPGAVLGTMKANHIGMKMSLFYQAYALYYEKLKRFEEAEKMYHLGAKNLAEPMEELQKSFDQFIQRMVRHKNKRTERQAWKTKNRPLSAGLISLESNENKEINENKDAGHKKSMPETQSKNGHTENTLLFPQSSVSGGMPGKESKNPGTTSNLNLVQLRTIPSLKKKSSLKHHDGSENHIGEDTVVVKFVGTVIVGKSEAEDACHHGLVEPTINTKEALNAINSMFQEPLEPAHARRRSHKSQPRADEISANSFEVFVDENIDNGIGTSKHELKMSSSKPSLTVVENHEPRQEPFQIYIDDDENNDMTKRGQENCNFKHKEARVLQEAAPCPGRNGSMFLTAPVETSKANLEKLPHTRVREDTAVYRFVGSTISEEAQVENVCHHGLVEPTINLKEAMSDINSMFGKPIEFVRKNRPRKQQDKAKEKKIDSGAFLILPDDEMDNKPKKNKAISCSRSESDLFEQTVCTKEAMAEINELFKMPLDF